MGNIQDLALLIDRHSSGLGDGIHDTAIPNTALVRAEAKSEQLHTIYRPCVCIVAQGSKRTIAGPSILDYAPGQYLTVSVDLPVLGQITDASAEKPYLCLKVELDPGMLGDLMLESALQAGKDDEPELGLQVSPVSPEIIDAAHRLVSLLGRPQQIGVLAPLYERELAFLLLAGPQGARLRRMAMREGRSAQVAKAIRWIAENFRDAISIEDAAAKANMSPSTFYEHFKNVTALSPLQFQKQLRLQEARRLLVSDGVDAASASFAVGYSSPQQFNREYARLFGAPPQRDASRLRAANNGGATAAAG
jgi:AraC-like DNA-binding protein